MTLSCIFLCGLGMNNSPVVVGGNCLTSGNFAACCRVKALRNQVDGTCRGVLPPVLGGRGRAGQVSQPIYLPGMLTSAAAMSEALPPGVHGGASEVARGIFGRGSNVLVPRASQTVAIRDLPRPPIDSGVPDYAVMKLPSESGTTQLSQPPLESQPPLFEAPEDYAASSQMPSLSPATATATQSPAEAALIAALLQTQRPATAAPSTLLPTSNRLVVFACFFLFLVVFLFWLYRRRAARM